MFVPSAWHALSAVLVCALLSTLPVRSEAPDEADNECDVETSCPAASSSDGNSDRTFFDGASNLQNVFSQSNVMVASDNPDGFFWNDGGRFIQSCVPAALCSDALARFATPLVPAGSYPALSTKD